MASGDEDHDSGGDSGLSRRAREWVLLYGSRGIVAALTAGGVFVALSALVLSPLSPLQNLQSLYYVFSGLLSGNLTIITVVVSINQLLLSREFNTPSQLRSQMEGVIEYRQDVEDDAGQVAPVEPLGFLELLYENTRHEAQRLGGLSITVANADVDEEIDEVVEDVTDHVDRVDALLDESDSSTFHVLSTTLTTNYARDINRLRRIKWRHGDELSDHVDAAIDDLIDQLQHIDIARQYFKAIYLQNELASLSRLLFYAGLPSVATLVGALFLFTAGSGASISPPVLQFVIPAAVTVGLLPLAVLFSFILRTATVAKRTSATLPFTVPAQEK